MNKFSFCKEATGHFKSGEGDELSVTVSVKAPDDAPVPALGRKASSHGRLTQHLLSSPPLPESGKRKNERFIQTLKMWINVILCICLTFTKEVQGKVAKSDET